jgi:hypothetical protein
MDAAFCFFGNGAFYLRFSGLEGTAKTRYLHQLEEA